MGLIKITADDLLKAQPPDEGWHLFKITEIDEKKASSGNSLNTYFSCVIAPKDDPNYGREIKHMINDGGNPAFQLAFHTAVLDMTIEEIQAAYSNEEGEILLNTDAYVGKKFWGECGLDSYTDKSGKTKTNMKIMTFQPESKPPF